MKRTLDLTHTTDSLVKMLSLGLSQHGETASISIICISGSLVTLIAAKKVRQSRAHKEKNIYVFRQDIASDGVITLHIRST